jgi:hypothetical protein
MVLLVMAPALPLTGTGAASAQPKHNCDFCHYLHGGSFAALQDFEIVEDLCDSCHGVSGTEPDQILRDGTWVTIPKNNGDGFDIHDGAKHTAFSRDPTGCWDCHNHEGEAGTNLSMIQANMPTPVSGTLPTVFLSRGSDAGQATLNSFADGDEDGDDDYTGVCEVCHTETDNHRNNSGGNHLHELGRTCPDCHEHDKGFAGGGPCVNCHNTGGQGTQGPNNRRAIIPEMSRASHHVGSAYQDDDCLTCHEFTEHQQGQVRLLNADDSSVIVYSGTPSDLEPFCLSCHDADGSLVVGGPPFSDGLTPPNVSAGWTSASHNATGGYTCWDCHDNPHGSLKQKLLAPADVAPDAITKVEEEEGFCFGCHDVDGPASSNVEAGFATTTLWTNAVVGGNSNRGPDIATLNDRHDVAYADGPGPSGSGAKIECADCHDPHAANGSNRPMSLLRADPDTSDGRVPGAGWFATMPGNADQRGTDAISEWCLDCHDGSFPAGVSDHSPVAIQDILNGSPNNGFGWLNNSHGAGPSGATLKTGTNYWALDDVVSCVACHQAHPDTTAQQITTTLFNNLFLMNDTVFGTDFSTIIPTTGTSGGYEITSQTTKKAQGGAPVVGYDYCNTCHTGSMGTYPNCFKCHVHNDGRF